MYNKVKVDIQVLNLILSQISTSQTNFIFKDFNGFVISLKKQINSL